MKDIELFNDHFQNYKVYGIPKAQLIIADPPYNLGVNAYASNPAWYIGGDNKNGESDYARFGAAVNFQSITTNKMWKDAFEECIKDTVEDELADAVIRLLDLAGLRKISLIPTQVDIELNSRPLREHYDTLTFTEAIYNIISSTIIMATNLQDTVDMFISKIFTLAESLKIDLSWHIKQKMKYNELREQMQGKKY